MQLLTDSQYLADTYSRFDVVFASGKGSLLFDAEGKQYIDFGSGIGVNCLGHAYPAWVSAVSAQAGRLAHASNLYHTAPGAALARHLCERTGMSKVFLSNSGAEANECAVKAARKYSFDRFGEGRGEVLTLEMSFHGRTLATLAATGQPELQKGFYPVPDGFRYLPADDADALRAGVTDRTCAVMIELIRGEGGVNPLSQAYVDAVSAICRERDLLLIVEEVQTGNGRTGAVYAYMRYGLQPDIVTTAKGLGGGLPIGATMFSARTADALTPGTHGSTFGGNPVACAGAAAVLGALTDELLEDVLRKERFIRARLSDCANVREVSGMGLMLGIDCGGNARAIAEACLKRGLVVLTAKNKVRLLPALNIDDETLSKGLAILTEVIG